MTYGVDRNIISLCHVFDPRKGSVSTHTNVQGKLGITNCGIQSEVHFHVEKKQCKLARLNSNHATNCAHYREISHSSVEASEHVSHDERVVQAS